MGKEEAKMSLFVGSMIIYVENPQGSIEKATRTNKLSKIIEYKVYIQKPIVLYILLIKNEKLSKIVYWLKV